MTPLTDDHPDHQPVLVFRDPEFLPALTGNEALLNPAGLIYCR